MKKVVWEVEYHALPRVFKYCKKCGRKTAFVCSEKFRVNAQRKALDIWLIYQCEACDTTWNASVYSRISPLSLRSERLEGFCKNEEALIAEYAMDTNFLHRNGVEPELPEYSVRGETFLPTEAVELEIKSDYILPIKVAVLVREKLQLSQAAYNQLVEHGIMKSMPEQNLKKYKLKKNICLHFAGGGDIIKKQN